MSGSPSFVVIGEMPHPGRDKSGPYAPPIITPKDGDPYVFVFERLTGGVHRSRRKVGMNLQHAAARQATVSHQRHSEAHTRLHGRWLVFARASWLALIIPSLGLFVIANTLYATQLIGPDNA